MTNEDLIVKCRRCGRTLKNPQAIALGIGAVCARKLGLSMAAAQEQARQIAAEAAGQLRIPESFHVKAGETLEIKDDETWTDPK